MFERVAAFVDPLDPEASLATAFVARGGYIVYLRPSDAEAEVEVVEIGAMGAGRRV